MDKAVEAAREALRNEGCNFPPRECMAAALTAADAARTVTDEEVAAVLLANEAQDHPLRYTSALHAAGLKVVRA